MKMTFDETGRITLNDVTNQFKTLDVRQSKSLLLALLHAKPGEHHQYLRQMWDKAK